MKIVDQIYARARKDPKVVVFPEANDPTMIQVAYNTITNGFGSSILLGNPSELKQLCHELNLDETLFRFVDVNDEVYFKELIARYLQRPNIIFREKTLTRRMKNPLYFAFVMQAVGDADITIGGFNSTTAEVIQAATEVIGLKDGVEVASACSLCEIPGYEGSEGNMLGVADLGACVNPDAAQLASIAINSCETIRAITGWTPRCALLSHSTVGSASNELVDKVVEAVRIANAQRPDLLIDGEFQVDAAINPAAAEKKVKRESAVAGKANILIFPNLDAGNIGAKIIHEMLHATFSGVLLQGFNQICYDSSRNCSVDELLLSIAICIVLAGDSNITNK
jgi:phosphate acetyltransferase